MPTIAHIIYIPVVLIIGIVLGYILANQAAKERLAAKEARRKHRNAPAPVSESSLPP